MKRKKFEMKGKETIELEERLMCREERRDQTRMRAGGVRELTA